MLNSNTATPIVFPKQTFTYTVEMTEDRCVASDQVTVRVVDFVTLNAGRDTTICLTDTMQLFPSGDGLKFTWTATPSSYISDQQAKKSFYNPYRKYKLSCYKARIGSCFAEDDLSVRTVPILLLMRGRMQQFVTMIP